MAKGKNSSARILAGARDTDEADVKDICLANGNASRPLDMPFRASKVTMMLVKEC